MSLSIHTPSRLSRPCGPPGSSSSPYLTHPRYWPSTSPYALSTPNAKHSAWYHSSPFLRETEKNRSTNQQGLVWSPAANGVEEVSPGKSLLEAFEKCAAAVEVQCENRNTPNVTVATLSMRSSMPRARMLFSPINHVSSPFPTMNTPTSFLDTPVNAGFSFRMPNLYCTAQSPQAPSINIADVSRDTVTPVTAFFESLNNGTASDRDRDALMTLAVMSSGNTESSTYPASVCSSPVKESPVLKNPVLSTEGFAKRVANIRCRTLLFDNDNEEEKTEDEDSSVLHRPKIARSNSKVSFGIGPMAGKDVKVFKKEVKTPIFVPTTYKEAEKVNLDTLSQPNPSGVFKPCNCKKSKCLKMYCECFARGAVCGVECNCCDCCNTSDPAHDNLRRDARHTTIAKDSKAFLHKQTLFTAMAGLQEEKTPSQDSPVSTVASQSSVEPVPTQLPKGCHCKKSHCRKKYCECFQAGVPCGPHCKCDECQNCLSFFQSGSQLPCLARFNSGFNILGKRYHFDALPPKHLLVKPVEN